MYLSPLYLSLLVMAVGFTVLGVWYQLKLMLSFSTRDSFNRVNRREECVTLRMMIVLDIILVGAIYLAGTYEPLLKEYGFDVVGEWVVRASGFLTCVLWALSAMNTMERPASRRPGAPAHAR